LITLKLYHEAGAIILPSGYRGWRSRLGLQGW
jgi:hypothetical protein